jgi:hypothetical protein
MFHAPIKCRFSKQMTTKTTPAPRQNQRILPPANGPGNVVLLYKSEIAGF